ncbi:MAG: hypothetical protein DHS20C17_22840 [Cyclobacteriaceae bacterium]|nr:MAG: hypothetical protein DHS20C17_22840 [Cyclobacteriaceae bacterium]
MRNSKLNLLAILFGCLLSCTQSNEQNTAEAANDQIDESVDQTNALTAAEKEAGWELLFDGESTDLWKGYNKESFPEQGWRVQDGSLIVEKPAAGESGGGDLITRQMYENFEFTADFMITDSANSGILYLAVENEGDQIWHSGPEYQILDDQNYTARADGKDVSRQLTAANYDLQAPPENYTKPVGEWNTARIVINNGHVEHWLNGHRTVEYLINSPEWKDLVASSKFSEFPQYGQATKGHIGLQDHGHEVRFRNIKIRELEQGTALFNGKDLNGWTIHGTEKWYVDGGNIVCESGPDEAYGYLATDKSFKDFDLTLEFKQEADGNSGVFFRSSLDGTKITGWQTEVAPPGHSTGGVYESYGRGWLIKPDPEKDAALIMGDWNRMRIRVIGDKVTTWLNGQRMIEFQDEKIGAAQGQIALQIHDGGGIKVRWRKLMLTEL